MTRRHASGQRRARACGRLEGLDTAAALYSPWRPWQPWHHVPDDEAAGEEAIAAAVRGAVESALTGRQREVVELYFFEGLSQGAIAQRLGVTQQVVHKCLHGTVRNGRTVGGALARLRDALLPWWRGACGATGRESSLDQAS